MRFFKVTKIAEAALFTAAVSAIPLAAHSEITKEIAAAKKLQQKHPNARVYFEHPQIPCIAAPQAIIAEDRQTGEIIERRYGSSMS